MKPEKSVSPFSVLLVVALLGGFVVPVIILACDLGWALQTPAHILRYLLPQIYLLPSALAVARGCSNFKEIFVLNLLAGWTVIGWIIALWKALKSATGGDIHFWVLGLSAGVYGVLLCSEVVLLCVMYNQAVHHTAIPFLYLSWAALISAFLQSIANAVVILLAGASFQLARQRLLRTSVPGQVLQPWQAAAAVLLSIPALGWAHVYFGLQFLVKVILHMEYAGEVLGSVLYVFFVALLQFKLARQFVSGKRLSRRLLSLAPGAGLIVFSAVPAGLYAFGILERLLSDNLKVSYDLIQMIWTSILSILCFSGPLAFCIMTLRLARAFFVATPAPGGAESPASTGSQ
jgi:hypothetical protein